MALEKNTNNNVIEDAALVRVRYSTIINYIGQLYWLIASIAFTIIVTRKLTVEEYGLFSTIMGLYNVIIFVYAFWCIWIVRNYARRSYRIVSTAFALNIIYAPIGSLIIIIMGYKYNQLLGYGFTAFTIASLLIVLESFNRYLRSIAMGSRPFIDGKVVFIRGTVRVIAVYIFVATLLYGLTGVIYSIVISGFAAVLSYYALLKYYGIYIPTPKIYRDGLKRIFKNSYISLVTVLSGLLAYIERPLLTTVTLNTMAAAYLGVSYIPRSVILRSSQALTSGLVAKLLRIPSRNDVEDVLRITFIINIGMAFLLIILSVPILSLFREEYVNAQILFIFFVLESLLVTVSNILGVTAKATEKKDMYDYGLSLIETPLFKIPLAMLFRNLISIILATTTMIIMIMRGINDPILMALPYSISWFITAIPLLIYMYKQARMKLEFKIPWKELISAIIAGLSASIYLHLSGAPEYSIKSFWLDTPVLLVHILVGVTMYFGILYLMSSWVRTYIKKIIKLYIMKNNRK